MKYNNLRIIREQKDISQQTIADLIGITRQQYHLYESGKREIPAHLLKMLADYYNTSIDFLVAETEDIENDDITQATFRELNELISDRYDQLCAIVKSDEKNHQGLKWVLSQYKRIAYDNLQYLEKQLYKYNNK